MDTQNKSPNEIVQEIINLFEQKLASDTKILEDPEADNALKAEALNRASMIKEKLELFKKFNLPIASNEKLSNIDLINAMKVTCYGNLMYCCGLKKPCFYRDAARAALHMNDALYTSKESGITDLVLHTKREFVVIPGVPEEEAAKSVA